MSTDNDLEVLSIPEEVRHVGIEATWEIAAILQQIIALCPLVSEDQTPLVVRAMALRASTLTRVLGAMLDNELPKSAGELRQLKRKVLGEAAVPFEQPDQGYAGLERKAPPTGLQFAERSQVLADIDRARSIIILAGEYLANWEETSRNDDVVAGAVRTAATLLATSTKRIVDAQACEQSPAGDLSLSESLHCAAEVVDQAERRMLEINGVQDAVGVAESLKTVGSALDAAAQALKAEEPVSDPDADREQATAEAALRVAMLPSGAQAAVALVRAVSEADQASYLKRNTTDLATGAAIIKASIRSNLITQLDLAHQEAYLLALSDYVANTSLGMMDWVPELTDASPHIEPSRQ